MFFEDNNAHCRKFEFFSQGQYLDLLSPFPLRLGMSKCHLTIHHKYNARQAYYFNVMPSNVPCFPGVNTFFTVWYCWKNPEPGIQFGTKGTRTPLCPLNIQSPLSDDQSLPPADRLVKGVAGIRIGQSGYVYPESPAL